MIKCNSSCRKRLFTMINDLPTIFEVVTGTAKKQTKEKSSVSNHTSSKSKSGSKGVKISSHLHSSLYVISVFLIVFSCIISLFIVWTQ